MIISLIVLINNMKKILVFIFILPLFFTSHNTFGITPTTNLVKNIGFNKDATTGTAESFTEYNRFVPKNLNKIIHPPEIIYDESIDSLHFSSIIKITDPRVISNYKRQYLDVIRSILPKKAKSLIKKLKK